MKIILFIATLFISSLSLFAQQEVADTLAKTPETTAEKESIGGEESRGVPVSLSEETAVPTADTATSKSTDTVAAVAPKAEETAAEPKKSDKKLLSKLMPGKKAKTDPVELPDNSYSVSGNEITYKMKYGKKKLTFTLSMDNLIEFAYTEDAPLGRLQPIDVADTQAILKVGERYIKGCTDAKAHYQLYKSAGTGALVLSSVCPLFGVAFGIPASMTPPKIENLGHPAQTLSEDPVYYQGYIDEAKRIKTRRVWLNVGVGTVVNVGLILGIISIFGA